MAIGVVIVGGDKKDDTLTGGADDDILIGLGGKDRLYGRAGNDLLDGGKGADYMSGGRGNDNYVVDNAGDVVLETTAGAEGGIDSVASSVTYQLGDNIEHLALLGTADIDGTGNALDNTITGNDGANVLRGYAGNDMLDGGGGPDALYGGKGNDTYKISLGDQVFETLTAAEGGGVDTVLTSLSYKLGANLENLTLTGSTDANGWGNELANVIIGNAAANTLHGGAGADTLKGGAGNDVLNGEGGGDEMTGGRGDDTFYVDRITDVVIETLAQAEGGGTDLVRSSISYKLGDNVENLDLWGGDAIDGTGNALDNVITGNSAANVLKGYKGDDTLIGAADDTLEGSLGDDTLVLSTTAIKAADGGVGVDTLKLDAIEGDIDLKGAFGAALKSIEVVDLSFNGSSLPQNVIIDPAAVAAIADTAGSPFGDHALIVKGDVQDSVTLGSGWTLVGTVSDPLGQFGTYNQYVSGNATLLVESDVATKGTGTLALGTLNGSDGFRIDGAGYHALSGQTWLGNIGDLNGDGYDDLLLGDPAKGFGAGGAAVVFGHAGAFPAVLDVASMQPSDGVEIQSLAPSFGAAVGSAGDLNGDGYADLIVGAPDNAGSAYVIFGHGGQFESPLTLDGKNGFHMAGDSEAGRSVASAGDINGDGFDDIVVGDPGVGSAYVVFGHAGAFDSFIALWELDGTNGFRLDYGSLPGSAGENFGYAVAGAGDINGDGYADMLVAGTQGTVVVFGHDGSFAPTVDAGALDGSNGFLIPGGRSVSRAGDINGDGLDDIIIGDSGVVVFGSKDGFEPQLAPWDLNGSNGFSIVQAGAVVSTAGDVNGDGYDDFIVAHPLDASTAGETYVVFGHGGSFDATLDLTQLTATEGLKLTGVSSGDYSGAAVSAAGDLNGDGYDDLVIGAVGAEPNGSSYVIFGKDFTGTTYQNTFGTAAGEAFVGTSGDDVFYGGGGLDSFEGATGNDQIHVESAQLLNLDGGAGFDTAFVENMGPVIDLTGDLRGKVSNIEQIWMVGGGANLLKLDTAAVAAMVGGEITKNGANTLIVTGDSADTVQFAGEWLSEDTGAYTKLTNGSLTVLVSPHVTVEGAYAAPPDLSKLDGTDGFRINGNTLAAASAGDVNGDGYDDLIVGADATPGTRGYIVYGHGGSFDPEIDAGSSGTTFTTSAPGGEIVWSVSSAGDINGDGFDDVIVGVPFNLASSIFGGTAHVVFGKAGGLGTSFDLATIDGSNGFNVTGDEGGDEFGWSVASAGDVNGDGYDDMLVGSAGDAPFGPGQAYLVFGHAGAFAANITGGDLTGANGFTVTSSTLQTLVGHSVAGAGDINGDGYDDFILGARGGPGASGESFVIFGHAGVYGASLDVDTLNGTNGFKIAPVSVTDTPSFVSLSSTNVSSAGDVNGDGLADLVIGVYAADPAGKTDAGTTYVVFGQAGGFEATVDLTKLDAAQGFRMDGVAVDDANGWSVASAGDFNGDGYADLIVSSHQVAEAGGGSPVNPGEAYVIFGRAGGFGDHIDLANLSGTDGFKLAAPNGSYGFGMTVAGAGDVNGDGFSDLAISDYGNSATYVVFGSDMTGTVDHLGGTSSDTLMGSTAAETFVAGDSRDYIYGNGGKDSIQGGGGSDIIHVTFGASAGETYTDINGNSQFDQGEPFLDFNKNGTYDLPGVGPDLFARVDGGSGYDFLVFDTEGALDFGNLDGDPATSDRGKISNVEALDFDNAYANEITLHKADILDMDPSDFHYPGIDNPEPILRIFGDASDTLHLAASDGWSAPDTTTLPGFELYASQGVKIAVETAIDVTVS